MTFDPQPLDRDHMIKRNGTSLSLVQKTRGVGLFDTNTPSDAPYYCSSGKELYYANNIHKGIFIKNLLDFSEDFSRSVAKNQFWYLDTDATTATDNNATNFGMRERALLSHEGLIVKTIIPLNRYSYFEGLSDKLLPPLQLEFEINLQNDEEMISKTMEQLEELLSINLSCGSHNYISLVKDRPWPMKICKAAAPEGMRMVCG